MQWSTEEWKPWMMAYYRSRTGSCNDSWRSTETRRKSWERLISRTVQKVGVPIQTCREMKWSSWYYHLVVYLLKAFAYPISPLQLGRATIKSISAELLLLVLGFHLCKSDPRTCASRPERKDLLCKLSSCWSSFGNPPTWWERVLLAKVSIVFQSSLMM